MDSVSLVSFQVRYETFVLDRADSGLNQPFALMESRQDAPKNTLVVFESVECQLEVVAQNIRHQEEWERQGRKCRCFQHTNISSYFFQFNFRLVFFCFVLYFFSLQIVLCYCYLMDHSLHSNKNICGVPCTSLYNYDVAVQNSIFFLFQLNAGKEEV